MIAEGRALIAAGEAKKVKAHSNQAAAIKNQELATEPKPDPVTGFYQKKPKRGKWADHEICSDPANKKKDARK